jgi:Kelch motif
LSLDKWRPNYGKGVPPLFEDRPTAKKLLPKLTERPTTKKQIDPSLKAHLLRRTAILLSLLALCLIPFTWGQRQNDVPSPKANPTGNVCIHGWSPGPDLPSPAVRSVGVYFHTGKFYLMGGRSSDSAGSDFTHPFEYDPFSDSWITKSATYPDNQVNNMACGVLDDSGTDYIYCVGGSAAGATTATDRVFRYDPVTDTINSIAAPWPGDADGITLPGGFAVFDNKLYILGGFQINTAMTDKIYEFSPGTNTWPLKSATLPAPRGYIPTASFGTLIYTAGGSLWDGTALQDTSDSFVYDPVADSISTFTSIPRATAETRALSFTAVPENSKIRVMGGGRTPPNPSNEVNIYEPFSDTWTTGEPFVTARRNFATDTTHERWIYIAGGYDNTGVPVSSMEIFCYEAPTPSEPPRFTPTPTPTPTATPSATPRNTPTPRPRPVPRPRPTP